MHLVLLLAPALLAQAPGGLDEASTPDSCIACHLPEPGSHFSGHGPYEAGNCMACHVENARVDLALDPMAATPLVLPNFMSEKGGRARDFRPEQQFAAPRPLILHDPSPTRHRGVRVDPALLGGADYVWVREGLGPWQTVAIEKMPAGYAEPIGEPQIKVEQRSSAFGTVAVVTVVAGTPIGAQVAFGGRRAGTAANYFSSELSLRLPLGHEPPAVLPVEIWSREGVRSIHEVRLADASARIGRWEDEGQPRVKVNLLLASASDDGYLEVLTPVPVKLEIRAPSAEELRAEAAARLAPSGSGVVRFADTLGEGEQLAELNRPDGAAAGAPAPQKVPHPEMAPLEYAGTTACLACHPGANAHGASHPLVRPKVGGGYVWPEDLPLGRDGQMQCITCHQPHGSKEFSFHTRKDGRRELCISCHAEPR